MWKFDDVNEHLVNDLGEAAQDVELLVSWHEADPPDAYDVARNDYVQSIQQNRNPFVDHPEYVDYIDFHTLGTSSLSISNVARTPNVPYSNQNTTVECDVSEAGKTITSVQLIYSINNGANQTVTMTNSTGDHYEGDIPSSAYGDGDLVEYYVLYQHNIEILFPLRQGLMLK